MRLIYFSIIIAGMLIFLAAPVKAQLSVGIGINISSQPTWGPTGYDNVQYYYLPDIDCYYYVPQHLFFFQSGGGWISSSNLPPQYAGYNLYGGYKVVINEDRPYMHDQDFRARYSSFKGRHDQPVIRDSHDSKYLAAKNPGAHNKGAKQEGRAKSTANRQANNSRKTQAGARTQANKPARASKPSQGGKQAQGSRQAQSKGEDKRK
jgi:hypothetical protein